MIRPTLILLTSLLLCSCASLSDRGQKALSEGDYEKALTLFQQATAKDTQDPDAKEGLRKAQQMWLSRKLIDVRLLRLGDNLGESENLLLQIIQKENLWRVFPAGAAFATQKEEIQLFAERVEKRIASYLLGSNPLAAQVELDRNRAILEKALEKNLSQLESKLYTEGKKFCDSNLKTLRRNEYYTGQWLKKTCQIWKHSVELPPLTNSVVLFGEVQTNAAVKGMNAELTQLLMENLRQAFLQSKWHDPRGKVTLDLDIEGSFTSEGFDTLVEREQTYFVQIPYEEKSTRIKTPHRDSSGLGLLLDLLLGTLPNERVYNNGDGTETVVVTKYRSEARVHRYTATEVKAIKKLQGSILASLDSKGFKMDIQQRYFFNEDRHTENFPDIGLRPSSPVFLSDTDWIQSTSQDLIEDLGGKLQQSWIERFCPENLGPELSEREQIHRCEYQVSSSLPEVLRQYYLKTWMINFEEWRNLVAVSVP